MNDIDDPFSPTADPYPAGDRLIARERNAKPKSCDCGNGERLSLSRRQALLGVGALAALPALAAADPFPVPCVQEKQQVTPCRHKYCRHYAGYGDYHGR